MWLLVCVRSVARVHFSGTFRYYTQGTVFVLRRREKEALFALTRDRLERDGKVRQLLLLQLLQFPFNGPHPV